MSKAEKVGIFATFRRRVAEALLGSDPLSIVDSDDALYRRLTDKKSTRDLSPMDQEQMLRICHKLYDSQPLAGWLIDGRVNLLLGDELGFSVEVDAEALKLDEDAARALTKKIRRALERFWDHPSHSIRYRADEYVTSLMVSGELCLVAAGENDVDGLPALDFVDSAQIQGVEPVTGSSLVHGKVVLKPTSVSEPPKKLEVIRFDSTGKILTGDCFFFRNSRLANAMRGRSELLRQADWIDALDQFLFARADRASLMNALLWDVTLEGAGKVEIETRAKEIKKEGPNRPGTTRIHNEKEKWNPIVPEMNSGDATGEVKLLRNYILGSHSLPESWFGESGDGMNVSAGEQSDVALMALRWWRKRIRSMFGLMLCFAYDKLHEKQPATYPNRLEGVRLVVDLPPMAERDISRLGGVIQNVEGALASAVASGRISERTARKVFLHVCDRLGVPVDEDEEAGQIDKEKTDRESASAEAGNAAALKAAEIALDPAEVV